MPAFPANGSGNIVATPVVNKIEPVPLFIISGNTSLTN